MPLKNKGLKEERVAKVGGDHLDKSTPLDSNKRLICDASSPPRGCMYKPLCEETYIQPCHTVPSQRRRGPRRHFQLDGLQSVGQRVVIQHEQNQVDRTFVA